MTRSARELVDATMTALATKRPIFHSESDFQHAFAWEARNIYPDLDVRLERTAMPGRCGTHIRGEPSGCLGTPAVINAGGATASAGPLNLRKTLAISPCRGPAACRPRRRSSATESRRALTASRTPTTFVWRSFPCSTSSASRSPFRGSR